MSAFLATLVGLGGVASLLWGIWALIRGPRLLALPLAYLAVVAFTWILMASRSEGYRSESPGDNYVSTRPATGPIDDFVTSDTCRSCHAGEYHSWHASFHRTMTQVASEESIKGDFESGHVAEFPGLNVRFSRDEDGFWATYAMPRENGAGFKSVKKRRIVMATGSHHYQVYWTDEPWVNPEKPDDRTVWLVPSVYLFEEQRWVPRHASFLNPPSDMPEFHRWNQTCSRCHSTYGIAKYDSVKDVHDTRAVELGISCEACHGPGREHIEANRNPLRRYDLHRGSGEDPTIVNPSGLDHRRSAEICGRCHSTFMSLTDRKRLEWNDQGQSFRPGDVLADHLHVMKPGVEAPPSRDPIGPDFFPNRFWSDGMVRVAGREYNGLIETPCFQKGTLSCLSCHDMHKSDDDPRSLSEWASDQLGPGMRGNAACTQCHESLSDHGNLSAHTHHVPGSSGSNCYNCHMPHTSYGLLNGIRAHQIDSPSVATSLETGRPSACNLCHLDETLAWTGSNLREWYGQPEPPLTADQQRIAASLLWILTGDAGQRALLASRFGWDEARTVSGTEWMPPFLAQLQLDPYHAVQIIANRSLRSIDGYEAISRYPDTAKAAIESIDIWKNQDSIGPIRPELLMDGSGNIQSHELERLLRMRDNRTIFLNE